MQNRYKIYPELHFGVSKLSHGHKTIEELLNLAEQFRKEKDFPQVQFQLTDLRGCTFDISSDRIREMKSLIDKYKEIDNQKLGVYLVDKPNETAFVVLLIRYMNYKRELCSTLEKAYDLLSLPVSFAEFKRLIKI